MKRTEDVRADGGRPADESSVFTEVSSDQEVEISQSERLRRQFDESVMAPARVAWNDIRARFGVTVILIFVLVGTVGVMVVPQPQMNTSPAPFAAPFQNWAEYPLGTDGYGRSIGKQLVHATPAMLKMVLAGAVISVGIAVIIGTVAGYKRGFADRVLMTLTDVVLTIPALPLIIMITAVFPPRDPFIVGAFLAIDNWPGLARTLRSQVLTIRQESYVEASRTMGYSTGEILSADVVPQLMPYITINAAGAARGVIFESVGLYYLGILPITTFNWGVMMNEAYQEGAMANYSMFHALLWPMATIVFVSMGFIFFSQGMDRVFNPRLRARHEKSGDDEDEASVQTPMTN